MKTLVIHGELVDFNTYSNDQRYNRFRGNRTKRTMTQFVKLQILKYPKIPVPAFLSFNWFVKNRKKDPDNICSAKKFILDALVEAKKLPNDGWSEISGFSDQFFVDAKHPRIEIEISY